MPSPLRIAFLGCGFITRVHSRNLRQFKSEIVCGYASRDKAKAAQFCGEFRGTGSYADYADAINDPNVDAVVIAVPPRFHLNLTLQALAAGKHVLVEKPVGVSVAEIEEMKRLADAKKLVCMPGHNYIYEAGMNRSKELIEGGDLGRLVSCYAMYNIHHPEEVASRYPGVVRQILTHNSYILLYLVGKPKRLCAMKACLHYKEYTEEDIAMVQLEMENGALAHLCASFAADDHAADPWTVMVKVIGTAGSTRYSYRDHVEIKPGLVHSQTYTAYQGSVMNEVRHFLVDCLRMGQKPLSTLDDAITAQKLIEAAEKSIAEKSVVKL